MNSSIYRFTLGLNISQSQISIPVMLGDTGREWHVNLSDGGRPYIIADGCLVMLSIKRPTGTRAEMFCPIEGNTTIVFKFDQYDNICSVEGIHDCDLTVYGVDKKVITTARFTMVVSDRVVERDDIVLTDEDRTILDNMITEEANRRVKEAERQNSESERTSAEAERLSSEEERIESESRRTVQEEGRVASETLREAAESIRVEKDAKRDASIQKALDTIGDIETAIDEIIAEQEAIIAIQNSLIGGDSK